MSNIWIISDTHFGHASILTFKREDGSPLRDFKDVNHMDETMIERWNSVVRPQDKVYHLGDVAMNPKFIPLVGRCNGHKRLILGNHDHGKVKQLYTPYFEAIYSLRLLDRMMFTHVPVHPDSIGKSIANIHGHTHGKDMGKRYFDVSVEAIDYTPISLEDLKKRVMKKLEA